MYYGGSGFYLRPVGVSDLPLLIAHRNDISTWRTLGNILPINERSQEKWYESLSGDKMYFIATVQAPTDPVETTTYKQVGLIRLTDIDYINRNLCIGIDTFREHRGKGYGDEFFKIAVKYCFEELNMSRLWLLYIQGNLAAKKIYEKAGFREEGIMRNHIFRNGKYHDYILMGLLKEEFLLDTPI